ncbi:putative hydrolase of the HAD superfamily [Kibdelosporangium banguiense]|uniref:Hydrolase of the HAD superfamily n=1 Tax=Kibdelosporangium banguiense TaxID=1365924 RepID=A0ABS4TD83_9PSEU|nr:HAD family hydrolase [Kibdelosporangium banguiense]MBP2321818.1 putative hydrolase of the HAD superfamily [Kibdelosporangium banguiense]
MKRVLIFDADDTLWENNVRFERVIDDFLGWLAHPTLAKAELRPILDDIERANIVTVGYGSKALLHNLRETFEHLYQRQVTDAESKQIEELAVTLIDHRMDLIEGVPETLAELSGRHELLMMTKGAVDEQQGKIDASDLARYFSGIHIVAEKDLAAYQAVADERSLDVGNTWMIGNSPKSDILPARGAGMNAVFIPNVHTWVLEEDELDPADSGVLHLSRFTELLDHF